MNLNNLRIVLVETSHPGNIGAAARAMKTMGLAHLILIRPAYFPHPEATARAAGAQDILARAGVVEDLDAALAGCHLAIGTSARRRHLTCPVLDPRQCAAQVKAFSDDAQIALVFGRERTGLSNQELDRCHFLVHIPANSDYSSLNLAAAVQIITYELHRAASIMAANTGIATGAAMPAPAEEMARFYEHLEQVLLEIGFLDPNNPRQLMRRLRRLFNRALPDQNEVKMLRGILNAVQTNKSLLRS